MMIQQCRDAGLPEPDFELRQGSFVVTLWRDWLTAPFVISAELRQAGIPALLDHHCVPDPTRSI